MTRFSLRSSSLKGELNVLHFSTQDKLVSSPKYFTYILVSLLASCLTGCLKDDSETSSLISKEFKRPVAWGYVKVYEGQTLQLSGRIQEPSVSILSFETDGVLETLTVDTGDVFGRGDLLGSLDSRDFRRNQRLAEVAQAEATLIDAAREYDRRAVLKGTGALSEFDIDAAETRKSVAERSLEALRAALALEEEFLSDRNLLAPFNGTVSRRLLEPGRTITAGQGVLEVTAQTDYLEAAFLVPGYILENLSVDQGVLIRVGNSQNPVPATIAEIGRIAQSNLSFPVIVRLDRHPNYLAGMSAKLDIYPQKNGDPSLTLVPFTAVQSKPNLEKFIYVINDENRATPLDIETAFLSDDGYVLRQGPNAKARIVVRGAEKLILRDDNTAPISLLPNPTGVQRLDE